MKLYYAQAACSLAPHIALLEAGQTFQIEGVNLRSKQYKGGDYYKVNPKGSVPALELDDGQVLTEAAVLLQYIVDRKPDSGLAPKAGTVEHYRFLEWLNYIATELHKGFGPLWNPKMPDDAKAMTKEALGKKFDYLTDRLKGHDYLMGKQYTVADAYLFTVLNWSSMADIDMSKWPTLLAYYERVKMRPATQAALKAEGMTK
jgi:glutathione S-transferase